MIAYRLGRCPPEPVGAVQPPADVQLGRLEHKRTPGPWGRQSINGTLWQVRQRPSAVLGGGDCAGSTSPLVASMRRLRALTPSCSFREPARQGLRRDSAMVRTVAVGLVALLALAVTPTASASGPVPPPEPARDASFSDTAVAAGGCYGHASNPEYSASLRNVYVQGYGQCSQPMDIQVYTRAQVYKPVNGVWKWVTMATFYGHQISIRVWAMGSFKCQTTTYRHWRTTSQGIVDGVSSTQGVSFEAIIPC